MPPEMRICRSVFAWNQSAISHVKGEAEYEASEQGRDAGEADEHGGEMEDGDLSLCGCHLAPAAFLMKVL